jgi:hypothetical protein
MAVVCGANDYVPVFTPDGAKIDTSEKAMKAVIADSLNTEFGLSATESTHTTTFFRMSTAIDGFAKPGDRIWQVHFINLERYVTKIAWVNAETGRVKFIYPKRNKAEQGGPGPPPQGVVSPDP